MALATVADVRQAARLPADPTPPDAELQYWLDVAVSYLTPSLHSWDSAGGTKTYFVVSAGQHLRLPTPGATVTSVRAFEFPDDDGDILVTGTYYVTDRDLVLSDGGPYQRLEVTWTWGGQVPKAVSAAIGLTAAALYLKAPKLAAGMRSERIGGYSYTLSEKDVEGVMPPMAERLLKPYRRRPSVSTT